MLENLKSGANNLLDYTGDLLLQKYYTVDFLTKKVARNVGQLPQYYVENSHEPIIPKEIFLQVQAEMARRRRFWQDFRYSHSNPLASKTICGSCGLPFRRVGTKWRCDSKLNRKKHPDVKCGMEPIPDEELREAIIKAMNLVPDKKEDLIRLQERLRWGGLAKADEVLAAIEAEMGSHSENYEEKELKRQWEEASEKRAIHADKEWQTRILLDRMGQANTDAFFRETQPVTTTDDDVIRYIETVKIFKEKIEVKFKAGISVEVSR